VKPRSKAPLLDAWPHRQLGERDLHLFGHDRNVGLILGSNSGGLVDVDCDWPEAASLAADLLPATGLVHGRSGSPHSHYWYRCTTPSAVFRLAEPTGRKPVVVELRAAGLMTIVPPSTHPCGELLVWERWGDPAVVSASELCWAASRLAAAALLCALGWSPGHALAWVHDPDECSLADLEERHRAAVALRAWLGRGLALRSSPRAAPALLLGRASPLTQAVLSRIGGPPGAASLFGLFLREGRQPCPFHLDSGPRSLQVTAQLWRCWAGCGSGNAIHLASRALGVSYLDARSWLARELGLQPDRSVLCDP
jgi:hypothetical protein